MYLYNPDKCDRRIKQADCSFVNVVFGTQGEELCIRLIELKSKNLDDIYDVVQKFENSINQLLNVVSFGERIHFENPALLIHPEFHPISLLKDQIMFTKSSVEVNNVEFPIHVQYFATPLSDITYVIETENI